LTGDIGGTNTRLAVMQHEHGKSRIERMKIFPSGAYASLTDIISEFRSTQPGIHAEAAAFGVAGPVNNGVSRITHLPWVISAQELAATLGLRQAFLLNDLEALAWGIDTLDASELVALQAGTPVADGNQVVIAAGTGLGEAGLCFDGELHRPFATEGGHTDFAPATQRDWELLSFLQAKYGHVSWERIVSGPGLVQLYEFLLQRSKAAAPDWLTDPQQAPAARITQEALSGSDELCVETLGWFVQLYGAETGNLALKMKASAGVYLGGGIAPKIIPALQQGAFLKAFLDKGRMRDLLESMPVSVISNEHVSLHGLSRYAAIHAAS